MTRTELLAASARGMSFTTEMVRALLGGIKSRTMRVIKPQPVGPVKQDRHGNYGEDYGGGITYLKPRHKVGGIVYVRETFCVSDDKAEIAYRATDPIISPFLMGVNGWTPSARMPKAAARNFLRITGVKVQRPLELTGEEILAEGLECDLLETRGAYDCDDCKALGFETCLLHEKFAGLWDSLRSKKDLTLYGYAADPWCWVYEFEPLEADDEGLSLVTG